MMILGLVAIVVQTGIAIPAHGVKRPAAAPLLRSESSSTGVRRLRVLVRIDAQTAARDIRIAEVVETVRAIWRPYAEIDFAAAGDATAVYDAELSLVITDRARPTDSVIASTLGWIEFLDGQPRNTITVSMAGVRALMSRGKWLGRSVDTLPPSAQQRFVTRALSRSSAHEIGHYLLRSRAHAAHGLMREQMTISEIMDDTPSLCQLLPREIASIDQRLADAIAEATAPDPQDPAVKSPRHRKS